MLPSRGGHGRAAPLSRQRQRGLLPLRPGRLLTLGHPGSSGLAGAQPRPRLPPSLRVLGATEEVAAVFSVDCAAESPTGSPLPLVTGTESQGSAAETQRGLGCVVLSDAVTNLGKAAGSFSSPCSFY